ncbi:hypothetical protein PV04_03177 [Phialophora macrospora]|uniref:Uncharacterized protein n=1 Tax=Phialophora macrospora TaxID=1851006 RepID=A0A0D2FWW4_9EURO|nr:hypothetical protein PV04_03177 [Phialophora macrospora]
MRSSLKRLGLSLDWRVLETAAIQLRLVKYSFEPWFEDQHCRVSSPIPLDWVSMGEDRVATNRGRSSLPSAASCGGLKRWGFCKILREWHQCTVHRDGVPELALCLLLT